MMHDSRMDGNSDWRRLPGRHPGRLQRSILGWCLALCWLAGPASAEVLVKVPLTLPTEVLQRRLDQSLMIAPGTATEVFRRGPCRHLTLSSIRLERADGRLRVTSHTDAQMGAAAFGRCFPSASFRGWVHFTLEPYLDEGPRLRFRITDSELVGEHGEEASLANLAGRLSRKYLHARLASFSLDLSPPRAEVLAALRAFAPPSAVAPVQEILRGVDLGPPEPTATGIAIPLELHVPARYVVTSPAAGGTTPGATEPPLTGEELAKVEAALQSWDAFLVFVVKSVGLNANDRAIRERLLETLLISRYHLVAILSGEDTPARTDPVRPLFLEAWSSLRKLVREAESRGLVQGRLLPYLAFVSAGDALLALDAAAPGLGLDISVDGLRRLARVLSPGLSADPLELDWRVDPALRELMDFEPEPQSRAEPSLWLWLADWVPAVQAAGREGKDSYGRLDHWLPDSDELGEYADLVGRLLADTASSEAAGAGFNASHAALLTNLVPATAMVESCWRQYTHGRGGLSYLRSRAGSVGMMQVNQYVWRGFYDLDKLKWDPAYNVAAGVQILVRYMRRFAFEVAKKTGDPAHIPRATYSVYNAGPKAARRFLTARAGSRERRVDDRFWRLYQELGRGGRPDLAKCKFVSD